VGNVTEMHNQQQKSSGWGFGLPFLGFHKESRSNQVKDMLKVPPSFTLTFWFGI